MSKRSLLKHVYRLFNSVYNLAMAKNSGETRFLKRRNGPTEGRTNGWTAGQMDGWTDPLIEKRGPILKQLVFFAWGWPSEWRFE